MSKTQTSSSDAVLRNLDGLLPDLEALYKDVHSSMIRPQRNAPSVKRRNNC